MRVVVVGGGLAGLAAALELLDAGHAVTVCEARPTLGGAVSTLPEREGDPAPPPDNGQHVALGCCSAYLGFLQRIGEQGSVRRMRLALPVIAEDASVAVLAPGPLGLLRYRHLTLAERVTVARAARALGRLEPSEHDGETFGELLARLGQTQRVVDRFWDVFIRPALNLPAAQASAAAGVFTVQTALLGARSASDLLLPLRPLGEMHGAAAGAELARSGARVVLRARVEALDRSGVLLASGERIEADGFVLAVPAEECAELLGEPLPLLGESPIVSAHLLFDRTLLRFPLAALLGSHAHWVFDRGRITGHEPQRGQYLTVVASGVPELLEVRGHSLVQLLADELTGRLGPAELLWWRLSREPHATFAYRPGTAARRPGPVTARPNVVCAGAWTNTGWPATMEGAIRSGQTAVRALCTSARAGVEVERLPIRGSVLPRL